MVAHKKITHHIGVTIQNHFRALEQFQLVVEVTAIEEGSEVHNRLRAIQDRCHSKPVPRVQPALPN